MPIPNVSTLYQKIAKGSEGGHEFARFIKLLLNAECSAQNKRLIAESDASGDHRKLDAYILGSEPHPELLEGFQFKFYPGSLTSKQRQEIEFSLDTALIVNQGMTEFIVVTPEDWQKNDQEWFDKLKQGYEKHTTVEHAGSFIRFKFKLTHWGHTKIVELALKHDHIGQHYFPELYPLGVGKFKLVKAGIDCENSNWYQYNDRPKTDYYQSYPHSRKGLITDPLFDFWFTNSSPEIFLLERIEIYINDITTQIKGPPTDYFLKSIGTIEYEVDFSKPVNEYIFQDPMIFEAGKPMRFKMQLRNFTKKCPGNCASVKFWFHFSNYSIPSEKFDLGF